jgi:protein-S-isoprenylcysteine O-methyltransferase Ste14
MRYLLLTLLILVALGPPLAALWFLEHSVVAVAGWVALVAFFAFFYWMLRRSQSLPFQSRGSMTRGSNRKAM